MEDHTGLFSIKESTNMKNNMGINLVLPFGEGEETEYVEMTIHPDHTITFPLYDFEHDEVLAELGEEQTPIYVLYKGHGGFNSIGLVRFTRTSYGHPSFEPELIAEILVEAVQDQGLGGFSEDEYIEFLKGCLHNEWKHGFEPLDMLKSHLSDEDYITLLKELVADESIQTGLSFDPKDLLLDEIKEKAFKKWLIEEIIKGIKDADKYKSSRGSYFHGNAAHLAQYLKDYIDVEDEDEFLIDETWLDFYASGEVYDIWRNVVGKEYCLWLFDEKVTCWRKVVENEILDPILFHGNVEEWEPEVMSSKYLMSDTLTSVLNELEVEEPELDDPEPPDHPKPDEDGQYATIYLAKSGSDLDNAPWWMIVPYESEFDAEKAVKLSDAILEKDGQRESFEIYTARKKDKPDERAAKQIKREFGEHDAITEHVDEGEEWDTRWTTVYDVLEKT